jgi:RNA recognition motif-containing protein
VTHAKLYSDQSGRSRGVGILEFATKELAREAIRRMNGSDLRGKRIVVQQLADEERDKHGYVVNKKAGELTGGTC